VRRDFDAIDDRASIDFTPPGVKRWASGFQERPSLGGASLGKCLDCRKVCETEVWRELDVYPRQATNL